MVEACPPLAGLSPSTRLRLAEAGREIRFAPGERIASIARPLRDILVLYEGWAKLVGITEEGVERILYLYRPCDIIGSRVLSRRTVIAVKRSTAAREFE